MPSNPNNVTSVALIFDHGSKEELKKCRNALYTIAIERLKVFSKLTDRQFTSAMMKNIFLIII